jgi:hypothetical protein
MSVAAAKRKGFFSTDESRETFVGWKVVRLSVGLGAVRSAKQLRLCQSHLFDAPERRNDRGDRVRLP